MSEVVLRKINSNMLCESVLKNITCTICNQIFSEPRLLSCLHTFCNGCIIPTESQIECTICKKSTPLAEGASLADALPLNTIVDSISKSFACGFEEASKIDSEEQSCPNKVTSSETKDDKLKIQPHDTIAATTTQLSTASSECGKEVETSQEISTANTISISSNMEVKEEYDHLGVSSKTDVLEVLKIYGDSKCYFSGLVNRVDKYYMHKERILVISESGMYLFSDPLSFHLKQRFKLTDIHALSYSFFADNHFILHIPSSVDILLQSAQKSALIELFKQMIPTLKINFSNRTTYHPVQKQVSFLLEGNLESSIDVNGKKVAIQVPTICLESATVQIIKPERKTIIIHKDYAKLAFKPGTTYVLELRFFVNFPVPKSTFTELISTTHNNYETVMEMKDFRPRPERYVVVLPEREAMLSDIYLTQVQATLTDPIRRTLVGITFQYSAEK